MKRTWVKLMVLVSGVLSLIGINMSSVQANTYRPNKQIAEVRKTTPVYLKLGIINKDKKTIKMTQNHYSHMSHHSHYSSRY